MILISIAFCLINLLTYLLSTSDYSRERLEERELKRSRKSSVKTSSSPLCAHLRYLHQNFKTSVLLVREASKTNEVSNLNFFECVFVIFYQWHWLIMTSAKRPSINPENWNLLSLTQYDFPNNICCNHRFLLWFNNDGWRAANKTRGSTSHYKNTTCNNPFTKWIIFITISLIYHSPLFEEQYM